MARQGSYRTRGSLRARMCVGVCVCALWLAGASAAGASARSRLRHHRTPRPSLSPYLKKPARSLQRRLLFGARWCACNASPQGGAGQLPRVTTSASSSLELCRCHLRRPPSPHPSLPAFFPRVQSLGVASVSLGAASGFVSVTPWPGPPWPGFLDDLCPRARPARAESAAEILPCCAGHRRRR